MDAYNAPPAEEKEAEDQKADQLAERCGECSAGNAHVQNEDEQRIERDVQ